MTESIQELQAKIAEYEKRMGIGEYDPAKKGYLVLVKILNQQNEYLDKFNISDKIGSLAKEDAVYPRAKEMWDDLPAMITKLSNLKIELKMEGEDKKTHTEKMITASDIADGNI